MLLKFTNVFRISAKILDPHRASRKFAEPVVLEDPNLILKAKQAARAERLGAFNPDDVADIDVEKKKAQRMEAAKIREEK